MEIGFHCPRNSWFCRNLSTVGKTAGLLFIIFWLFLARRISRNARIEPVYRWQMPSESEIGENGLPSPHYGSDHVAVMVEFQWCDVKTRR